MTKNELIEKAKEVTLAVIYKAEHTRDFLHFLGRNYGKLQAMHQEDRWHRNSVKKAADYIKENSKGPGQTSWKEIDDQGPALYAGEIDTSKVIQRLQRENAMNTTPQKTEPEKKQSKK